MEILLRENQETRHYGHVLQQQILRSLRSRLRNTLVELPIAYFVSRNFQAVNENLCILVLFNSTVTNGTVCLFSLKNPSYPEWICPTESPVMCLDFNAQHPHLLVIGMYNEAILQSIYFSEMQVVI